MGLLHGKGQGGLAGALWELGQAAQAAGLPQPPALTLPALPPLGTGCDPAALTELLGAAAADAVVQQLQGGAVQALLTGNLTGAREQLLGYLGTLDAQAARLAGQQADTQGTQGALGQALDTLGGLRAALGAPPGEPLAADLLAAVTGACPAVGGLLAYAESAAGSVSGALSGVDTYASTLAAKTAALTTLRGKAEALLAQVDAHITQQTDLLTALGELTVTGGP